jgi:hypothetical protein
MAGVGRVIHSNTAAKGRTLSSLGVNNFKHMHVRVARMVTYLPQAGRNMHARKLHTSTYGVVNDTCMHGRCSHHHFACKACICPRETRWEQKLGVVWLVDGRGLARACAVTYYLCIVMVMYVPKPARKTYTGGDENDADTLPSWQLSAVFKRTTMYPAS